MRRMSTVSRLRNEQGRQKFSDRETDELTQQVKPVGEVQSAEPFPARDNGKSDERVWEAVFSRENMQTALKRVESNWSEPRYADGKGGARGERQTGAKTHPSVPEQWRDGEWGSDGDRRRYAARRAIVALTIEHHAERFRQGVGEAWA